MTKALQTVAPQATETTTPLPPARRASRLLVAGLLAVKLAVTLWNCATFDGQVYDTMKHARRASTGGLAMGPLHCDPPL